MTTSSFRLCVAAALLLAVSACQPVEPLLANSSGIDIRYETDVPSQTREVYRVAQEHCAKYQKNAVFFAKDSNAGATATMHFRCVS